MGKVSISRKKLEANRRNARLSTGPRTQQGKSRSRWNRLKHGILASALLITEGEGAEDRAQFEELLSGIHRDRRPVGTLEGMLTEKVAVCWWRMKRVLRCEAGLVERGFISDPSRQIEESLSRKMGLGPKAELVMIRNHLSLPLGAELDRMLRYETTIQRQLVHAINQLERLQRIRKGENVPAPVSVQLSSDR